MFNILLMFLPKLIPRSKSGITLALIVALFTGGVILFRHEVNKAVSLYKSRAIIEQTRIDLEQAKKDLIKKTQQLEDLSNINRRLDVAVTQTNQELTQTLKDIEDAAQKVKSLPECTVDSAIFDRVFNPQ